MIKSKEKEMDKGYYLPENLIILISGVPGVGKTTISWELIKVYQEFRLVEETDIIREILRGYNNRLASVYKSSSDEIYTYYSRRALFKYTFSKYFIYQSLYRFRKNFMEPSK